MRRILVLLVMLVFAVSVVGCSLGGGGATTPEKVPSGDSASQGPDTAPALEEGVVRVTLGWDEPIDLDLEIWDENGENAITSAGMESEDVMNGEEGREYFDFAGDYVSGTYVVSVYFAEEQNVVDSAKATVTVFGPDGTTESVVTTMQWEEGKDQWHAFSIDAATGQTTTIDQVVTIEVTE